MIEKHDHDWKNILEEYQELRKPDADAIADMAVANFIEMREKTADPKFLLQKKIEARLHEKYPDKWTPTYSMVTFSPDIRYSEALERGEKQEAIMREMMEMDGVEKKWDDERLHSFIIQKIQGAFEK